jgi:dienelactone hydrolase
MLTPMDTLAQGYERSKPRLAFRAGPREKVAAWQDTLHRKLADLSGLERMAAWRCEPRLQEDVPEDMGDHLRQRVVLQTAPDYGMPLYVLKPKSEGPFKPVIALHGHGRGKADVVGLTETEEDVEHIRRLNYDYALGAVRQGYIVFVPDKRGFGERKDETNNCLLLATSAILMGMSVIGMHTWDNQRLIDHIETRDDCRPGPVGCIGLSGGGGGTLWLAAMDDRVGVAVISGHLAVYESGKFGCICNVVPHLLEWAERADIAGLICPRPLLIESASRDQCYSRERTLRSYRQLRRIYEAAGAADKLDIDEFEGEHEWSGRKAWPWLKRWL